MKPFRWFPWRFVLRRLSRTHGFIDPIGVLAQFSRFARPAEIVAPGELMRAGAILHARGLINSQAIQHNLDWIWPYWVEQQFDPRSPSFIPRAFSLTHINLTHRNWTAVGLPEVRNLPIVDPRGLVTPFWDGWSLDFWVVSADQGPCLFPSRIREVSQFEELNDSLAVVTSMGERGCTLTTRAEVTLEERGPMCRVHAAASANGPAFLVVSLRPYNPEGVSFVNTIRVEDSQQTWRINHVPHLVRLSPRPERTVLSTYAEGDVHARLPGDPNSSPDRIHCDIGLASAAAVYPVTVGRQTEAVAKVPLTKRKGSGSRKRGAAIPTRSWHEALEGTCRLSVPDHKIQRLYERALRTLILHTPGDRLYAGPYTYKRFWFRDAVLIGGALLHTNLHERLRRIMDRFAPRQTHSGYFLSQEGEWDSNGQVLWLLRRFCRVTGNAPSAAWLEAAKKGARWIVHKRLSDAGDQPHAGLMPAGFSAEHLGPNDHYYWDSYWSLAGLHAAVSLLSDTGDKDLRGELNEAAEALDKAIARSLAYVKDRLGAEVIPASPHRRLDSGAVGSLVAGYPLQLVGADNPALLNTADYLLQNCMIRRCLFHDISHSGINPYLTLHIAQVLLRAGDIRYLDLMEGIAELASPTGQWPEAIHPTLGTGCMGDGQHVWAAAEWIAMVRNCFVREEENGNQLVLCSGLPAKWLTPGTRLELGPTQTPFGALSVVVRCERRKAVVEWEGIRPSEALRLQIRLPWETREIEAQPQGSIHIPR